MSGVDPDGVEARVRHARRWRVGILSAAALVMALGVACCGWVAIP